MTSEDEKKIADAKKKYAEATTDAERSAAHAEAEAIRANYGYSGGSDGSQNIKLSSNNGDWIGDSSRLAKTQKQVETTNTSTDSDYASELNRLKKLQQEATAQQLKAQKEKTLQSLAEQEAEIQPKYYEQKRQAGATSALGAKSFSEYLANRGLTNSGAAAQGEINRQSALQGTLGELGTAEAQEYAQIARARQNAEENYASSLASANAEIEADYYNNLITENQRQRQIKEQLAQQAAQQYSDDYQAQIDKLLAQGYSPNSTEVLTLQALRGQKIADASSGTNYNYAIQQIQNGNINYNTALNAGMTVAEAQNYYKQYQAQLQAQAEAEAEQQAIENAQSWTKIQNDINNTNSLIEQRKNSGGSTAGYTSNVEAIESRIDAKLKTAEGENMSKEAIKNWIDSYANYLTEDEYGRLLLDYNIVE